MTVWLYLYWKYFSGGWWPKSTTALRRERIRFVALPGQIWRWSLWTGMLAVTSLVALEMVVLRMGRVPATHAAPLPRMPIYSLIALAVMSAVAAGIPEEVGYMQVPVERRYGPVFGVLLFALAHLNHGLSILLAFDFLIHFVAGRRIVRALTPRPLTSSSGTDLWFWACMLTFVLLSASAVHAYRALVRVTPDPLQPAG